MKEREVFPLRYSSLMGLSERQLKEHHNVLYAGYVNKINEIDKKLQTTDWSIANATYSELRGLLLEQTFATNAVRLHESYFENLGGTGTAKGDIVEMIAEDFGSQETFMNQFLSAAMCSRGWTILAYDSEENRLKIYNCDVHNQGGVWNCFALLVLDVYEHAYFIDYGTNRKAYLEAFSNNINWDVVNDRIKQFNLVDLRKTMMVTA